jgi:Putative rhamnosyl transferase
MSRPAFFRRRLAILRATLWRSLASQTCQDFEWIVFTDVRAGDHTLQSLEDMQKENRKIRSRIHLVDPISTLSINPRHLLSLALAECPPQEPVLTSRVDDDDALNIGFVESLQTIARAHDGPMPLAIGFNRGVEIYPLHEAFKLSGNPQIAIGLSTWAPPDDGIWVYSYRHTKISEKISRQGGCWSAVRTKQPMWLYNRMPTNDSTERMPRISRKLRSYRSDPEARDRLAGILAEFALPADWGEEIRSIDQTYPDDAPPFAAELDTRMEAKRKLLKEIEKRRARGDDETGLVEAFYAL